MLPKKGVTLSVDVQPAHARWRFVQRSPLLGPEHRQVGQALDAEPARKAALLRSLRQNGGDERKGQHHPDRALALALVDGERLDRLGGVE